MPFSAELKGPFELANIEQDFAKTIDETSVTSDGFIPNPIDGIEILGAVQVNSRVLLKCLQKRQGATP